MQSLKQPAIRLRFSLITTIPTKFIRDAADGWANRKVDNHSPLLPNTAAYPEPFVNLAVDATAVAVLPVLLSPFT